MSDYGESNSGVASGNEDAGDVLLVDDPLPGVRRLTMNRPEKRNSLIHPLRGAILEALREADMDQSIKVSIIRNALSYFQHFIFKGISGKSPIRPPLSNCFHS